MNWRHDGPRLSRRELATLSVGGAASAALTRVPGAQAASHGLVHFASSDHSPEWPGYMDGAIRQGERAASEVLARL